VNFDNIVNLVLEGDFDPFYDVHFSELSPNEIENLPKKEREHFSRKDKSERKFYIVLYGNKHSTIATSKNSAIGNIAYNIGLDNKIKTSVIVKKLQRLNVEVFDDKWKIKY
jgi:hypothetical protein